MIVKQSSSAPMSPDETTEVAAPNDSLILAICLMGGAMLCFVFIDTTLKTLAQDHNVVMLAGTRNAMQVALMLLIAPMLPISIFRTKIFGTHALRGLFLAAMTALMALSLHYNTFAQTYSLALGAPVIASLLAWLILKERIETSTWACILLGLAGVTVALQPWGSTFSWTALIAVAAAAVNGTVHVLTRLGRRENPIVMAFWTAVMATLICAPTLPWTASSLGYREVLLIGLTGALGTAGHLLMAYAFRRAPTALVSPVIYTQILWGSGIGLIFFGETVSTGIVTGAGLIIASGIGLVVSQAQKR